MTKRFKKCPKCDGNGRLTTAICRKCDGRGYVAQLVLDREPNYDAEDFDRSPAGPAS